MTRCHGGPLRKTHRRLSALVLLLYRLRLDWIARRLARWANVYIVGDRGPEWFIPAELRDKQRDKAE